MCLPFYESHKINHFQRNTGVICSYSFHIHAPQIERARLIFEHNRAPTHYGIVVCEFMNKTFPRSLIGRNGWEVWHRRSPDLSLRIYIYGDMLQQTTAVKSKKEQFGLFE